MSDAIAIGAWRREALSSPLPVGAAILGTLALTCLAPWWLLALGPIVVGVPHVLADVRYLVIRPRLHRRGALVLAAGVPLVAVSIWGRTWIGFLAAAAVALVARAPWGRRLGLASLSLLVAGGAAALGDLANVGFAHLHNVVAVLAWWAWRRARGLESAVAVTAIVVAAACVAVLADRLPVLGLPSPGPGFALADMASFLAPGLAPAWAARVVLSFAFLQAMHYALWLRLIPAAAHGEPRPSLAAAWRDLRRELGWPVLALTSAAALALALWAVVDLSTARAGYLRAANFHGHLELAALVLFALEGWPRGRADEPR